MGFAQIVGHRKQLDILRAALAGGRLHHAYLFLGPEGVGKRTVALALAKAAHCAEVQHDFCGQCVNCARITGGNHADVRLIEPLADKKEISIQQIRELERDLTYRSFTGNRKVVIIDPATLMNPYAQNALLKTLEEPPEGSLIILIATNAGGLLPTVRSRCLPLVFAPLPRAEVAAFLRSEQGMTPDEAELWAALGMGSIGASLHPDRDDLMEKRRVWSGILGSLKSGDYRGAMSAAETLAANREEALKFLKWAESWYRDRLIHGVKHDSNELVNLDMRQQFEESADDATVAHDLAAHRQVAVSSAAIQRNLNRRMVLEQLFFAVVKGR